MINLISDTVTKPSTEMLECMIHAKVGDDVFRQDPTVKYLERQVADMFGMEDALFCPSGTMTNQIAIKLHTNVLDEVICDHYSHIYQYEGGGYAGNAGVSIYPIKGIHGKITADQIQKAIRPSQDWLPISKLVVLENSCNKGGGSYYTLDELSPITDVCRAHNLKLHLDGARIFNVLVETGEHSRDVGKLFDTISICFSKGLGAPIGSILIGAGEDMAKARKIRKTMGGGMRQAGFLAAACTYALKHNIDRLRIDNDNAKRIGTFLLSLPYVSSVMPVQTNIVIFNVKNVKAAQIVDYLALHNISSFAIGPKEIRFVFHLDISEAMISKLITVLGQYVSE